MQHYKKRVFNILQMGYLKDFWSKSFDVFISVIIILNLFVTLFSTFEESIPYANILYKIEFATIIIFTIEYILRLWTSDYLYPYKTRLDAAFSFIFSFFGLLSNLRKLVANFSHVANQAEGISLHSTFAYMFVYIFI